MATRDETISGGRELDDLLQTLAPKMHRNINRAGLRAGAVVFREEVRANVPVASGDLKKSVRITTRARGGQVSASVKIGNSKAWYAHLVEFGTRPHIIKAKPRSGLDVNGTVRREVSHPGSQGKPFVRPAVDSKFPEAVKAVENKIRQLLNKQGLNSPAPLPSDPTE